MLRTKLFRELRLFAGQFITIFLMVFIAALAFAGVHSYMDGMEDSGYRYYEANNLEDLWITGENFTKDDLAAVKAADNVKDAERVLAFQCTWIRPEGNVTIETNFIETNEISKMHVFDGEAFAPGEAGMWLDYYLAKKLGVSVGDEIPLSYGGYTITEKVRGLVGTPDHVYSVKDSTVIFTDHTDFGFAYLSIDEFPMEYIYDQILESDEFKSILDQSGLIQAGWALASLTGQSASDFLAGMGVDAASLPENMDLDKALSLVDGIKEGTASVSQKEEFFKALDPDFEPSEYTVFPQIIVDVEDTGKVSETARNLETVCPDALAVTDRTASVSYAGYRSEIDEGKTYSVIFTGMFIFIAVLSVVTTMNRFVRKQRIQIGTLKALGFRRSRIIRHYAGFGLIIGLLGVILGTIAGTLTIGKLFLAEEMETFLVPEAVLSLRPVVYIADVLIVAVITLVTYLSCRKILKEPAAAALRVERPKVRVRANTAGSGGLLKNASFAVKWNLRDIRRNKTRSLMAVAGIAGSCILIVTAFGMRDSLQNYVDWEFNGILHFDWQLSLKEGYTEDEFKALTEKYGDKTSQTLPVEFYNSKDEKVTNTVTVNDAPGLLRLSDHNRNYFDPEDDGIYLTEKLAAQSGYKVGDVVKWRILGQDEWIESSIIGLNRDPQNQQMAMSRAYFENGLGKDYKPDTIYTDEDLSGVDELPGVETISSVDDLAGQMTSMLSTMDALISILIVVSCILGFVIIYNMGILSLTEKTYQFATLKVLGFRYAVLRKIFMTQNMWLTVISVIIGLPGGYLMTDYIFKEAIGDRYDFFAMIKLATYVIGLAGTLVIAVVSSLYLARKLKKIDMVSSLKANE